MAQTQRIPESVKREHPFQRAGLGLAPFRCVGMTEKRGNGTVGAPGQPLGTCQYCGTGIAFCFRIRSADGKEFVVGSDCVRRTYQEAGEKIPTDMERAIAEQIRDVRRERAEKKRMVIVQRYRAAKAVFETMPPATFSDRPHPYGFKNRDTGVPLTLRDYMEYSATRGANSLDAMKWFSQVVEVEASKIAPAAVADATDDRKPF